MARFKAHIATLFLIGFLFPQGASSMHYFVVPHPVCKPGEFNFNKFNDFEYHTCIYHLNGFSPLLLKRENLVEIKVLDTLELVIKFCCLENYVHQPDYNFKLRGPPPTLNIQ